MEKLAQIQAELKAPKNQFNKFGGYKYRNCEDILEAVKPLLNGAILTISDEIIMIGERYYVRATATYQDGDYTQSATAYAREEETKKGMDGSQLTGSTSSYARKYALNGLFCIDDTKDADSTEKPVERIPRPKPTTVYPTPDEFREMLSFCKSEDDIKVLLNKQRSNPELSTLIPLATGRKNELAQEANKTAIDEFIKQNAGVQE